MNTLFIRFYSVLILQWEQPSYTVMENETGIEVCFNITGADSIEGSAIVTVMTSSVGTPPNSATCTSTM